MPSPFIQSVFDSDSQSPQLSYLGSTYVKQEPAEFMDFLIPYSSPEKSLEILEICSKLQGGALRANNSGTSVTSVSPLLTHDSGSCSDESSFGSDSRAEVDEAFIHQISRFSDLSPVRTVTVSGPDVTSASSPSKRYTPKLTPASDTPSTDPRSNLPCLSDGYNAQIFSRKLPSVLFHQPNGTENWVECIDPIAVPGRVMNVTGWEPSENDKYPFVNVDLEYWPSLSRGQPTDKQDSEGGHLQQESPGSRTSSSSGEQPTESSHASKHSWGRRTTSNRQIPEGRKKRRIDGAMRPGGEDYLLPMGRGMFAVNSEPSPSSAGESATVNTKKTQAQYALTHRSKANQRLNIPRYVFPQPGVARAITRRAAEEERQRAVEANMHLMSQPECDDEAEETRKLVDEFLDIPDAAKEQILGNGGGSRKLLLKAFNPSRLPSQTLGAAGGARRGLRPARSLLEYSASTRRRALLRSRSEAQARSAVPLAEAIMGERLDDGRTRHATVGVFPGQSGRKPVTLDTFPPMKRVLEEDAFSAQRGTKRVRVS